MLFLTITTIFLLIALLGSLYVSGVLYKRITTYEDQAINENKNMEELFDDLKASLELSAATIKEVAGYDVVSEEPFVKRVVQAVNDAYDAVSLVQSKIIMLSVPTEDEKDSK